MESKTICCPICSSDNIIKFSTGGRSVGRCQECHHAFLINPPQKILDHYYDKRYWSDDKNRQGINSLTPNKEWDKWLNSRLKILDNFGLLECDKDKPKRVLEFGCSEGMLLYTLKQRGFDVMGNDVCAIAEESRKALGLEISQEPIELFSQRNLRFDMVMSFHVIEHLRDPLMVTRNLTHMLSPGGVLLMHVPVDDVELDNVEHYHFFSDDSCRKLMSFFTTDIKSLDSYYWV